MLTHENAFQSYFIRHPTSPCHALINEADQIDMAKASSTQLLHSQKVAPSELLDGIERVFVLFCFDVLNRFNLR